MIPRFDSTASVKFSYIESNNDTFKKLETQLMLKKKLSLQGIQLLYRDQFTL